MNDCLFWAGILKIAEVGHILAASLRVTRMGEFLPNG
jgi:hypothetical protein